MSRGRRSRGDDDAAAPRDDELARASPRANHLDPIVIIIDTATAS
jgi:hypothetical protein